MAQSTWLAKNINYSVYHKTKAEKVILDIIFTKQGFLLMEKQ